MSANFPSFPKLKKPFKILRLEFTQPGERFRFNGAFCRREDKDWFSYFHGKTECLDYVDLFKEKMVFILKKDFNVSDWKRQQQQ